MKRNGRMHSQATANGEMRTLPEPFRCCGDDGRTGFLALGRWSRGSLQTVRTQALSVGQSETTQTTAQGYTSVLSPGLVGEEFWDQVAVA